MIIGPDGFPIEKPKAEESEPEEKPSDSPKKPLLMTTNKPKGAPKRAPGPGGIGGMAP